MGKRVMVMEVPGNRRRGRPKRITSGTTCRRENCQGRKNMTGLKGGVSQETSTNAYKWERMRKKKLAHLTLLPAVFGDKPVPGQRFCSK